MVTEDILNLARPQEFFAVLVVDDNLSGEVPQLPVREPVRGRLDHRHVVVDGVKSNQRHVLQTPLHQVLIEPNDAVDGLNDEAPPRLQVRKHNKEVIGIGFHVKDEMVLQSDRFD